MSQGDRSERDRRYANDSRRDDVDDERPPAATAGRRSQPPADDDLDIPPWAGSSPRGQNTRRDNSRGATSSARSDRDATPSRSNGGRRDPLPQLGDAFKRRGLPDADADDRSSAATRDPYDRMRRVAAKPPKAVEYDDDDRPGRSYFDESDDPYDRLPPVPREETGRARRRQAATTTDRRTTSGPRVNRGEQLNSLLAAASPHVRELVPIAAIGVGSLLLMILVTALRIGSVAPWLPIHLNAEGAPDLWGSRTSLWQLPLMAGMVTIMAGALAWFMNKRDPFVAKFALLGALMIQALCWIGLAHLLW